MPDAALDLGGALAAETAARSPLDAVAASLDAVEALIAKLWTDGSARKARKALQIIVMGPEPGDQDVWLAYADKLAVPKWLRRQLPSAGGSPMPAGPQATGAGRRTGKAGGDGLRARGASAQR